MIKNIQKHLLLTSGFLKPFEEDILTSADSTLEKITTKIRLENVDIVFFDQRDDMYNNAQVDPDTGLGQFAINGHVVYIAIDGKLPSIREKIRGEDFTHVLSHALYHCMRGRSMQWIRGPLIEGFISEGLAGHFEEEISGTAVSSLYSTLPENEYEIFKKKAEKSYWDEQYNWGDWFLGNDPSIPYGYGHSYGYRIVEDYLRAHPNEKPSTLYDKQPREIIAKQ